MEAPFSTPESRYVISRAVVSERVAIVASAMKLLMPPFSLRGMIPPDSFPLLLLEIAGSENGTRFPPNLLVLVTDQRYRRKSSPTRATMTWSYAFHFQHPLTSPRLILTHKHDAVLDYYGRRLATCSSDKTIKIFEVDGETHKLTDTLRGYPIRQVQQ